MLCRGCGFPIVDQYLMKIGDSYWHERCVKCSVCGCDLQEKCFQKFGLLHCTEDYFRHYSTNHCFCCGQGVSPHDMVYKLGPDIVCHVPCQRCAVCGAGLGSGSRICVDRKNRHLLCLMHSDEFRSPSEDVHSMTKRQSCPSFSGDSDQVQMAGEAIFPSDSLASTSQADQSVLGERGSGSSTGYVSADQNEQQIIIGECPSSRYIRRRGPRTTIRPMQLETLNKIFGTTPKPSKQARARLALETGLSMRVIQFQNRRSKERRLKHLCNWIRQNEGRSSSAAGVSCSDDHSLLSPLLPPLHGHLSLMDDDQVSGIEDLLDSDSSSSEKQK